MAEQENLTEHHGGARTHAVESAEAISDHELLTEPLEVVLERLVQLHCPPPAQVDIGGRWASHSGTTVRFYYPVVERQPSEILSHAKHLDHAGGDNKRHWVSGAVFFDETLTSHSAEEVNAQMGRATSVLDDDARRAVEALNLERAGAREAFADTALQHLETRLKVLRLMRGALDHVGIPLAPPDSPLPIPVEPAGLSLNQIESAVAAGQREYVLENEVAESIVQTISSFGHALERLPNTAMRLLEHNEESLRDVLLFALNANFQGQVTGETFVREGKADLLLQWHDRDAFVGECKVWNGPSALDKGLTQLLTRYTLWRHSRIALVVFILGSKDADAVIAKAHRAVQAHDRFVRTVDASEPRRRGDYEVRASHDEQRSATLTLIPVVIQGGE